MTEVVVWRLLRDGARDGAENMARDEALLDSAERGSPPTLRLYAWTRPTLSLGAHQPGSDADLDACRRLGVDLVRRPTGGGAVLHDAELTYAVAAQVGQGPFPASVIGVYERIAAALVAGLEGLGVSAESARTAGAGRSPADCFARPSSREILVGGRKLIGSAQVRRRGAFLQHGSILIAFDPLRLASVLPAGEADAGGGAMLHEGDQEPLKDGIATAHMNGSAQSASALRSPESGGSAIGRPGVAYPGTNGPGQAGTEIPGSGSHRATEDVPAVATNGPATLREITGRAVTRLEVEEAVCAGFRSALAAALREDGLDDAEAALAARLRTFKYLDASWTLEGRVRGMGVEGR